MYYYYIDLYSLLLNSIMLMFVLFGVHIFILYLSIYLYIYPVSVKSGYTIYN